MNVTDFVHVSRNRSFVLWTVSLASIKHLPFRPGNTSRNLYPSQIGPSRFGDGEVPEMFTHRVEALIGFRGGEAGIGK